MRLVLFASLFACVNGCPGTCCSVRPHQSSAAQSSPDTPPPAASP